MKPLLPLLLTFAFSMAAAPAQADPVEQCGTGLNRGVQVFLDEESSTECINLPYLLTASPECEDGRPGLSLGGQDIFCTRGAGVEPCEDGQEVFVHETSFCTGDLGEAGVRGCEGGQEVFVDALAFSFCTGSVGPPDADAGLCGTGVYVTISSSGLCFRLHVGAPIGQSDVCVYDHPEDWDPEPQLCLREAEDAAPCGSGLDRGVQVFGICVRKSGNAVCVYTTPEENGDPSCIPS